MSCVGPLVKVPVAVNCCFCPAAITGESGVTAMDVNVVAITRNDAVGFGVVALMTKLHGLVTEEIQGPAVQPLNICTVPGVAVRDTEVPTLKVALQTLGGVGFAQLISFAMVGTDVLFTEPVPVIVTVSVSVCPPEAMPDALMDTGPASVTRVTVSFSVTPVAVPVCGAKVMIAAQVLWASTTTGRPAMQVPPVAEKSVAFVIPVNDSRPSLAFVNVSVMVAFEPIVTAVGKAAIAGFGEGTPAGIVKDCVS